MKYKSKNIDMQFLTIFLFFFNCIFKILMAEATVTKSILKAILKLQDLEQAEIFIDLGLCIYQKVVMVALQASVIF